MTTVQGVRDERQCPSSCPGRRGPATHHRPGGASDPQETGWPAWTAVRRRWPLPSVGRNMVVVTRRETRTRCSTTPRFSLGPSRTTCRASSSSRPARTSTGGNASNSMPGCAARTPTASRGWRRMRQRHGSSARRTGRMDVVGELVQQGLRSRHRAAHRADRARTPAPAQHPHPPTQTRPGPRPGPVVGAPTTPGPGPRRPPPRPRTGTAMTAVEVLTVCGWLRAERVGSARPVGGSPPGRAYLLGHDPKRGSGLPPGRSLGTRRSQGTGPAGPGVLDGDCSDAGHRCARRAPCRCRA